MRISAWSSDVCSSDLQAWNVVELAPTYLLDDIPRLRQAIAEHRPQTYLVSRRTLRSMNSWMNNVPVLSRGKDRCTLLIHPDDAAALDVDDRDHVAVTSGESRIVVQIGRASCREKVGQYV